jgi:hypothetical protein
MYRRFEVNERMRGGLPLAAGLVGIAALLAACSSSGDDASTAAVEPNTYCQEIAPLWDSEVLPNIGAQMSGAERATTVTTLQAAITALPQGVELGALTAEQSDVMVRTLPIFVALYENPDLIEAGPDAAAEAIGMPPEELASLNSSANSDIASDGIESLVAYCKPSGTQ